VGNATKDSVRVGDAFLGRMTLACSFFPSKNRPSNAFAQLLAFSAVSKVTATQP